MEDWRGIQPRSGWINGHIFTVRQMPGARHDAPLSLDVDGVPIPFCRLGSDDYMVRFSDKHTGEIDRAILRLLRHDGVTVQVDGTGPEISLDVRTLRLTVPPAARVDFLSFIYQRHLRPTLVFSSD